MVRNVKLPGGIRRWRRPKGRMPKGRLAAGLALLGVGALLLGTAGAYYGYTFFAGHNLDRLVYQPEVVGADRLSAGPSAESGGADAPPPGSAALYPGGLMPARQWADPRGTIDFGQDPLLEGFTPVSALGQPSISGLVGQADRIAVPALGIDVRIEELAISNLADSRAYETPKWTVGHIPSTPNPGSHGNGWYFGHLESPVQGEGNVFAALPRVPALLRDGEDIYIVLESDSQEYLYRVFETDLVHQNDLELTQAGDARITLVTCFPRLKYDQRLLITAQLVGFRGVVASAETHDSAPKGPA